MVEFKDKKVQQEYDWLDDKAYQLESELEDIEQRMRELRDNNEQE